MRHYCQPSSNEKSRRTIDFRSPERGRNARYCITEKRRQTRYVFPQLCLGALPLAAEGHVGSWRMRGAIRFSGDAHSYTQ